MGLAKATRHRGPGSASPVRAAGEGAHPHVGAGVGQQGGLLGLEFPSVARLYKGIEEKVLLSEKPGVMAEVYNWAWCFHAEFVHFWVGLWARSQGGYVGNWAALSLFDATVQLSTRQRLLENPPLPYPGERGRYLLGGFPSSPHLHSRRSCTSPFPPSPLAVPGQGGMFRSCGAVASHPRSGAAHCRHLQILAAG